MTIQEPEGDPKKIAHDSTSDIRKNFDYVEAIINLMVRNDEVVAAVGIADQFPTTGIISCNNTSDTPSGGNSQVSLQYS